MAVKLASHLPKTASDEGVIDAVTKALGDMLLDVKDQVGEITLTVRRDSVADALRVDAPLS